MGEHKFKYRKKHFQCLANNVSQLGSNNAFCQIQIVSFRIRLLQKSKTESAQSGSNGKYTKQKSDSQIWFKKVCFKMKLKL